MVTGIRCPVCSENTEASLCPSCETDLSPLHETRHAAYRLARKAEQLARERQISQAADKAERGMQLFLNDELGELFGWLLFLDGRFDLAGRCWESVPNHARALLDAFNRALEAAQRTSWDTALDVLKDIEVPFRPGVLLQFLAAEQSGATSLAEEARKTLMIAFPGAVLLERPWSPASAKGPAREDARERKQPIARLAAAGLALLLTGAGFGYWVWGGPQPDNAGPASESATAVTSPTPAESPESNVAPPAPDSLRFGWSYLQADPAPFAQAAGDQVPAAPIEEVRRISTDVRREVARRWYLDGLRQFEAGSRRDAAESLHAALVSVGATSSLYWVDDALYLLMHAARESNPGLSHEAAEAILTSHRTSIYANSVTRSVAGETS